MKADDKRHDGELNNIGYCAANACPHQAELRQTIMAKDEAVIDDRVQNHSATRNDGSPNRLFQRSNEITQHQKAQKREDRPHIGPHKNSGIRG